MSDKNLHKEIVAPVGCCRCEYLNQIYSKRQQKRKYPKKSPHGRNFYCDVGIRAILRKNRVYILQKIKTTYSFKSSGVLQKDSMLRFFSSEVLEVETRDPLIQKQVMDILTIFLDLDLKT